MASPFACRRGSPAHFTALTFVMLGSISTCSSSCAGDLVGSMSANAPGQFGTDAAAFKEEWRLTMSVTGANATDGVLVIMSAPYV